MEMVMSHSCLSLSVSVSVSLSLSLCLCSTGGLVMVLIQIVQIIATRKWFVMKEAEVLKGLALTNR